MKNVSLFLFLSATLVTASPILAAESLLCASAPELGQVLQPGVPSNPELHLEFTKMLERLKIGSAYLNGANSPETFDLQKTKTFIESLRPKDSTAKRVLIAVDQEGGNAQAFGASRGFSALPRPKDLANYEEASLFGIVLGTQLREAGIDWTYAPVVDVIPESQRGETNHIIESRGRAFFGDATAVTEFARAVMQGIGLRALATAKHFPGRGSAGQNDHLDVVRLDRDLAALEHSDLLPFKSLMNEAPAIMVSHVITKGETLPSSLNPKWIKGYLRETLGYKGLIITDGMHMQGVLHGLTLEEASFQALKAGNDILLLGGFSMDVFQRVYDSLCQKISGDNDLTKQITESAARLELARSLIK